MTKNHTTVEFRIETLENRDAPMTAGSLISGGAGEASYMTSWGEYKQNGVDVNIGQSLKAATAAAS